MTLQNMYIKNAALTSLEGISPTDGNFIVGNGTKFVAESGTTARTSLGVAIGSDVQAFGAILDDFNTLTAAASDGQFIVATGVGVFAYESTTVARTSLGVGEADSPKFAGGEIAKDAADAPFTLSCFHDTETTTPLLILRKADGTEAAPALVDDNAILGTIKFQGYDGSGYEDGAHMYARIRGAPSDGTDMPTEVIVGCSPDGSSTPTDTLYIKSGKVGVNVDPDFILQVASGARSSGLSANTTTSGERTVGGEVLSDGGGNLWLNGGGATTGKTSGLIYFSSAGYKSALEVAHTAGATSNLLLMKSGGTVGITAPTPSGTLSIGDATEGGTATINVQTVQEAHTLAAAATSDTSIDLPAGVMLLGVSFCVNTAVTDSAGDDTWSAEVHDGASMHSLAAGAAAAQNTKINTLIDASATSIITDATTNIRFTPNGGNFSAGVIEVVVYYLDLTSLANV